MKRVMTFALVCVLILGGYMMLPKSERVSWGLYRTDHIDGYGFGESPFSTITFDPTSEQAKAALKAQIDAADPGYNRVKAEKVAKANWQLYFNWRSVRNWWDNGIIRRNPAFPMSNYMGQFSSFSTVDSSGIEETSTTTQTSPTTTSPSPSAVSSSSPTRVIVDLGDGTPGSFVQTAELGSYFTNPPTRPGYTFIGWFDENGNQITESSDSLGGHAMIAHWDKLSN